MTMILDAGALVAVERGDRDILALIKQERLAGRAPVTHGGIVGQVWRGGNHRQVPIARLLAGTRIIPIDDDLGRSAGTLLAKAGTATSWTPPFWCSPPTATTS
jgi:hypothetical protein